MCGIAGAFYSRDHGLERIGSFVWSNVQQSLAHRGPDDSGLFVDEVANIGLAHTRLSIIDPSSQGHQPMLSPDGSTVLIFNGEIYNFRELRVELQRNGVSFSGNSDTEVLLKLYLAEGEEMLHRLNGIFSLAVWDRPRQSLFIARDAFGVKPLYYTEAQVNGRFAFASELKALLHFDLRLGALDEAAVHRYLAFLWCPGEGTPFKGVRKLGPGEALEVKDGRIERHWHWYRLPAFRRSAANSQFDEDYFVSGCLMRLRTAVQRQMVGDVPVGAFLSGGLDSSAVVALAREVNPNIRCFSIEMVGGPDAGVDADLPYAWRVSKHLNVPLDVVRVEPEQISADLERMIAQLDEPLADPAALNVFYISQLARKHGIKVLLSGVGGDDLFGGYRRHRAIMLEQWWTWLPLCVRRRIVLMAGSLNQNNPMARRLARLFGGAEMTKDDRLINYFRWIDNGQLRGLFSDEFRAALGGEQAEAPMRTFLSELPPDLDRLERILALEQRFFLADHNLAYTDKMSMAAGVEVRVPFLDLDLVEFAAQVPPRLKQRRGEGKWVLKKAMEPYLPREVIYRSKTGFGVPMRRWMRYELRDWLGSMLSTETLRNRGIFKPEAVQRMIADNDAGRQDATYPLFSLLCMEIWFRHFSDANG